MIKRASTLRSVTLKEIVLQGTDDHFKATESALYGAPHLKEYEMIDCDAAVKGCSLEGLEKAGQKMSIGGKGSIDPVHKAQTAKTA
jgi:hypothetical protein